MRGRDFSDATLLLVAHGSTVNPDSAAAAQQHARALRERNIFREVLVAFWKEAPSIREAVVAINGAKSAQHVFVAPLFLSDGYFTRQVIPLELGLLVAGERDFAPVQQHGTITWIYCAPFGTHSRMTDLVIARAEETLADTADRPPSTDTALLLAAHGTDKNEQSRQAAEWQVTQVRARRRFAEVHAVFMEEEPRIANSAALATVPNIVVVPFFMSDGMHTREDIPVLLGGDKDVIQQRLRSGQPTWLNPTVCAGKRIWYSRSIGTSPLVDDVVLARVFEASDAA